MEGILTLLDDQAAGAQEFPPDTQDFPPPETTPAVVEQRVSPKRARQEARAAMYQENTDALARMEKKRARAAATGKKPKMWDTMFEVINRRIY